MPSIFYGDCELIIDRFLIGIDRFLILIDRFLIGFDSFLFGTKSGRFCRNCFEKDEV